MIERLGVKRLRMKKDSFLRNLFYPFRRNSTIRTILYILYYDSQRRRKHNCTVQDRSIISSRSRFFVIETKSSSIWRRELPSVVCNYRSCEGVTHQEQTVYTVGCLSIPVVTITSTARRAFVWATRHEIGGENRSRDAECETREHGCFQAKCLLYAFIAGLYASRGITEEGGIAGECMQHRFFTDIRYLIRR